MFGGAVQQKIAAVTHLLIVTGCRRGEIAGHKWENVYLKGKKIQIDCTLLYSKDRGIYSQSRRRRSRCSENTVSGGLNCDPRTVTDGQGRATCSSRTTAY